MGELPAETELASKLASLRDIAAEIYERGLNCVLSPASPIEDSPDKNQNGYNKERGKPMNSNKPVQVLLHASPSGGWFVLGLHQGGNREVLMVVAAGIGISRAREIAQKIANTHGILHYQED